VVVEAVGQGTSDRVFASVSYTLAAGQSIELMSTANNAGTGAINLTGNELANTLLGNAGANMLNGGAGSDTLTGLGGDDTFYIDSAGDTIAEAAGQGSDTAITNVSYTLGAGVSVEVLRTYGSGTTDVIDLTGNELANTVLGNAAANVLNGGAGADQLRGYAGNDSLTGGSGTDTFVFNTALGAGNVDLIHGYSVVDDVIQIDNAVFTGLAGGALAAGAFRIGAVAADADDRIIYNSATGELLFDADGNGAGAAVLFADMSVGLAMTAGEFFVI
jgi:Ca2+-binding RTX toxin-like protein